MDIIKKYLGYAQLILIAGLAVALALLWYFHQGTERNLKTTREALTTTQGSLDTALKVNSDNVKTQQAALDQIAAAHSVADINAAASAARDKQIGSILNAIRQVPPADLHPVSPLVCDTVDRLYDDGTKACGG